MKGIDVNPQMLEIARRKADKAGLMENIELDRSPSYQIA